MMTTFKTHEIFPKFLMADADGRAMCKAIEAGLKYFLEKAGEGLKILLDVDEMPEWRLDELAWEYNCLYDYDADVEIKREWIRNAYSNYRLHGTAEGIRQYLSIYFGESWIEEYWEFGGDPGEFNVTVVGQDTEESEAWIRKAVAKAKNVRSELHNIVFSGDGVEASIGHGGGVTGVNAFIPIDMIGTGEELFVEDIEDMYVEDVEIRDVRMLEK